MVGFMTSGGGALATETPEFASPGTGDDGVRLLRLAVFEDARPLEDKAAVAASNPSGESLESDEGRRAVAAVDHQVFDMPLAVDLAGERLHHRRARHLRQILAFAVGLLVPALDGEPCVRGLLHVSGSSARHHTSHPPSRSSVTSPYRRGTPSSIPAHAASTHARAPR